jgi:hypothetical protein
MDKENLRWLQKNFEGDRQEFVKKEMLALDRLRLKFVKIYNFEKIKKLKPEEYVIGKKNSFCYWLEVQLKELGNIHGSTAFKFGIYFGKTKSDSEIKYRFLKKYGKTPEEAFRNVKEEILKLLIDGESGNLDGLQANLLAPMVKGKILSLYYSDRYLNIFDKTYLDYYLEKLGVHFQFQKFNDFQKRGLLLNFKNSDEVMSGWTVYEFTRFLIKTFGRPARKNSAPPELQESFLPDIKKALKNLEFINYQPGQLKEKVSRNTSKEGYHKPDYEKKNRINKEIGDRGELIALCAEIKRLKGSGQKQLVEKVRHVSETNDWSGYDIQSFNEDGSERYIEVKAIRKSDPSDTQFVVSANEINVALEKKENYFLYLVFDVDTENPKIQILRNPFELDDDKINKIPTSFRVHMNLEKIYGAESKLQTPEGSAVL